MSLTSDRLCELLQSTLPMFYINSLRSEPRGGLPLIYDGGSESLRASFWGALYGFRVSFFKLVYFLGYEFESFVPRPFLIYF